MVLQFLATRKVYMKEDWVGWVSQRMMHVMINCPSMGQMCPIQVACTCEFYYNNF